MVISSVFECFSLSLRVAETPVTVLNIFLAVSVQKLAMLASFAASVQKECLRPDQRMTLGGAWADVTPTAAGLGVAFGGGALRGSLMGVQLALSSGVVRYHTFEMTMEELGGLSADA